MNISLMEKIRNVTGLWHKQARGGSINLNSQKKIWSAKVLNKEITTKRSNEIMNQENIWSSDYNIIYINENVNGIRPSRENK